MKKLIATMAACLFVLAAGAADLTNAPLFQIGLVVDTPSNDTEQMSVAYPIVNGAVHTETFTVRKTIAFDQSVLKSASVITNKRNKDVFEVQITFNDEGQKRLAEFTRQNIGRHLAIILFGQLDSAPMLKSELLGGTVWVGRSQIKEAAKDLAAKINAAITKK
jgi:preprotein translocase subunit SecD